MATAGPTTRAVIGAAITAAIVAVSASAATAATVTVRTVKVGAPGNASVAVVPFTDAIYQSCSDAPQTSAGCQSVGGVSYQYGIGELEITVKQWVAFLNTVDPAGSDPHDLYEGVESSSAWPKYGQINESSKAARGHHYSVGYPQWADKPYGFANFLRSARFANALYNGKVLAKTPSSAGTFKFTTYRVRLSRRTETTSARRRIPSA